MSNLQIVKLIDPIQMTISGTFTPKGAYNGATDYAVGDSVDYNGSSYVMYVDAAAGTVPTNTTYWQILANKGDTGAKGDTGDTGPAGADGADGADGLTVSVNSVTQVAGDISLTQDNIPDGTTNKAYTAAEQTKLSGIEALADVTDATNVAAAGAVMDGDFSANGVMARTAAGTYTNRTITGTANQITVTNGDGVSGNPTLALPQNIHTGASPTFTSMSLTATGASYLHINADTTALTPSEAQLDLASGSTYARHFYRDSDKNYGFYINGLTMLRMNGTTGSRSIQLTAHTYPSADSTYTLGTSSLYWKETYTDRLYLNSTAYLDGATAGQMEVRANNFKIYGTGTSTLTNNSNGFVTDGGGIAVAQANGFALGENAGVWKSDFSLGILSARRGMTTAPVGDIAYGANVYVYANYDDAADTIISVEGKAEAWSSSGGTRTIGTIIGIQGNVNGGSSGFGSATNVIALNANIRNTYPNATHTFGLKISSNALGTNRYGAYIGDVSGGTLNYSIYTNAGDVRLMASATDKLGFHGATPVAQQSSTPANATDLSTAITLVNDLKSKLVTLGLIA